MERISDVRGKKMIEIRYELLTVLDTIFLLSNYEGFLDGDKGCLIIERTLAG